MKSKKPADASAKNKLPSSSDSLPEDFLADDSLASPHEAAPLEDDFAALDFEEMPNDDMTFGDPISEQESIAFGEPMGEEGSLAFDEPAAMSEPAFDPMVAPTEVTPQSVAASVPVAAAVPVAPVKATPAPPIKPLKSGSGKGRILAVALASFLIVGAMTLAVGSTMVALQQIKQHERASEALASSVQGMDRFVAGTVRHSKLKGPVNIKAREEILAPAMEAYSQFAQKYATDDELLPEVTSAQFHLAALHAKTASSECATFFEAGAKSLDKMREMKFPAERYPSLEESCFDLTTPMEWGLVKTVNQQMYGFTLVKAFQSALSTLQALSYVHPKATQFRSDAASMQRTSAILLSAVNRRSDAIYSWIGARDELEQLVKQEPGNVKFQTRLAEALIGAARLQQQDKAFAEAKANFQRAVEVREQLAAASPDDKALKDDVASAKRDLANVPAAPATALETPAAETPAPETPAAETPAPETPAPEAEPAAE